MKTGTVKREILLLVTTTACNREWRETDDCKRSNPITPEAQLEEACLNGLLEELLMGLTGKAPSDRRLCIWHIRQGESLLQLKLSTPIVIMEKQYSIDPCFFLPLLLAN